MTWFRHAGLILIVGCVSQNDALTPPLVQNADLLERDVLAVIVADHAHEFSGTLQLLPTNAFRFDDENVDTALVGIPRQADLGGVVIGLSHVGFSRDYRRALVYTTNNCGALCGAGYFVFLERDATNVWRITGKRLVWVS
jgi:hypothetical protein